MPNTEPDSNLPVLYSFRRCPYAMRARMALRYSKLKVILREVSLKNKPQAMLQASSKATVPVLVINDGTILDESLDIMFWALQQYDEDDWASEAFISASESLIKYNDNVFKIHLDHYKYADRFPHKSQIEYRRQAEEFIQTLEDKLSLNKFLLSENATLADVAIFPFIRQFAYVDIQWFEASGYEHTRRWLSHWINSALFQSIMHKYDAWQPGHPQTIF